MSVAAATDVPAAVRAWVADRERELVDFLGELVRVPSLVGTSEQEGCQQLVADALAASSITPDRWTPPWDRVRTLTDPDGTPLWSDVEARSDEYEGVLATLTCVTGTVGSGGPEVVLNGHVDVVPAADQPGWSTAPFEPRVHDGDMYGRGTMDMKGGLAAAVFAVKALAELRLVEHGRVTLASVVEEESGGNGTLATLEHGVVGDGVVFCEPTGLRVVHRHVGIAEFRVDVRGRAGTMLHRDAGDSAITSMARIVLALDELERRRTEVEQRRGGYAANDNPGFVNVGFVDGGEWLATRAERCSVRGLMGTLPLESAAAAAAALRDAVAGAGRGDPWLEQNPAAVTVLGGAHGGGEIPADHPLVASFSAGARAVDPDIGAPTQAGSMVCDAKVVHGGGFAPAIAFGPAGAELHGPDERVSLASVVQLTSALALGALTYLDERARDMQV